MNCPVCKEAMLILEFKGVEIDYCLSCRGCWLDWGELGLFLRGQLDTSEEWDLRAERQGRRRCPRCRRHMKVGALPDVAVEVDVCPHRHGVWLDGGELEQVVRVRIAPECSAQALKWLHEVFGGEKVAVTQKGGAT